MGPTYPTGPHRRNYEQAWWARGLVLWQRISPLLTFAVFWLLALGFDFKTPKQWFESLQAQQHAQSIRADSIVRAVADLNREATNEREEISRRLDGVARLVCIMATPRDRTLVDFCAAIRQSFNEQANGPSN